MSQSVTLPKFDVDTLRGAIRKAYAEVATNPTRDFHFHTGRPLAQLLGYPQAWVDALPESAVASLPNATGGLRTKSKRCICGRPWGRVRFRGI